eukprot:COSAG01_NODE_8149_length_2902_cov_7.029254_2_plen_37_part_00
MPDLYPPFCQQQPGWAGGCEAYNVKGSQRVTLSKLL